MPASLIDLFATDLAPLLILGHDHRITLANEGMYATLGLAPDDLIGESFVDLVHSADRAWIDASLMKLGRNLPKISFDGRLHHADGGVRWMSWVFRRSPSGTVYASGRDESVRRQVEKAVRRRERRRKAMLDHTADPLVVLDKDGRILDANAIVATLFQSTSHELVGRPIADFIPLFADRRPPHGVPFEAVVEGPNGAVHLEIRTNGFIFEKEAMVVATARDVGKRKAHSDALASLSIRATLQNEAKSHFVSEMSHAMRTPLSAILGYTEMLIEAPDTNPLLDLRRIQASAGWLLELVDNALDLSRIETGTLELNIEEIELVPLTELLHDLIRPSLQGSYQTEILAEPVRLHTDGERLRQILTNLLTQAVQRAGAGKVRLTIRDTEEEGEALVAFEIHDDGPVLSFKDLESTFEPFATGGRTHDPAAGLGLSIAKRLTQSLGGHLTATSHPANGTVFTVFLPR